jgi:hypothetical protein
MLEVSRDAFAEGEEKLVSCAYITLGPCGDLPFTSWSRWQCLRGGADGLNGCRSRRRKTRQTALTV